jgi:hypothetical protein
MGGTCSTDGMDVLRIKSCCWQHEAKRPPGRSVGKWENKNKRDFKDVDWEVWIRLTCLRVAWRVPVRTIRNQGVSQEALCTMTVT